MVHILVAPVRRRLLFIIEMSSYLSPKDMHHTSLFRITEYRGEGNVSDALGKHFYIENQFFTEHLCLWEGGVPEFQKANNNVTTNRISIAPVQGQVKDTWQSQSLVSHVQQQMHLKDVYASKHSFS